MGEKLSRHVSVLSVFKAGMFPSTFISAPTFLRMRYVRPETDRTDIVTTSSFMREIHATRQSFLERTIKREPIGILPNLFMVSADSISFCKLSFQMREAEQGMDVLQGRSTKLFFPDQFDPLPCSLM